MATFTSRAGPAIASFPVAGVTRVFPTLNSGLVILYGDASSHRDSDENPFVLTSANRPFLNSDFGDPHFSRSSIAFLWEDYTHVIPQIVNFGTNPNVTLPFDIICVQRAGASVSMSLTSYSPVLASPTVSATAMTYYEILTVDLTIDVAAGFTGAFDHRIPITGGRATLVLNVLGAVPTQILQFRPDSNSTETWEYLTDVMHRIDGQEQRFSMRNEPRATLSYTFTTQGNLTSRMHSLLASVYKRIILVPLWFVFNLTTAPLLQADRSTIQVATADIPVRVGDMVLLWESDTSFGVREIQSITASSIAVTSPFARDFPIKSLVVPTARAILSEASTELFNPQENYARFTTQLLVEQMPTQTYTNNYPTYNSDFVFTETNITRLNPSISATLNRRSYTFQSEVGRYISEVDTDSRLSMEFPFTVMCQSKTALVNMRRFVQSLRGSLRSFYVSSQKDDLHLVSVTSSSILVCTAILYRIELGFNRNQLRHIEVEFPNGTINRREITAVTYDLANDLETFTLDSALTVVPVTTNPPRISFLYYVRIADDNITFEYVNPITTYVTFNLATIKEEN